MALEGLKGYEFDQFFNKIEIVKDLFLAVCSIDRIPQLIPTKHFVVCNLSTSDQPGTHWIVIFHSEPDTLEIFNSLGYDNVESLKPYFPNFEEDIKVEFNVNQLQPNDSSNCGYYCIYFAIHRICAYDVSFDTVLEEYFSLNKIKNDELVVTYCKNLLQNKTYLVCK
jgi:hypothetical protein